MDNKILSIVAVMFMASWTSGVIAIIHKEPLFIRISIALLIVILFILLFLPNEIIKKGF